MKDHQIHLAHAKKKVQVAYHMLTQTYPLVDDEKLLLAVASNLHSGYEHALKAALVFERAARRIPPFHDDYKTIWESFANHCAKPYKVEPNTLTSLRKLGHIIDEREKSPVEFGHRGSFVICSKDYKMEKITVEKLKVFINDGRKLIHNIQKRFETQ